MYSFSADSKFLIITDGVETWKLEKNQVSLKTANELVIIDRNGMHYKNFAYTEVSGGYANATAVVAYLETLVNIVSEKEWCVTHDGAGTSFKIDSVDGVAPTDNDHLFTLLSGLIA